jgi:phospho-N-acetylmuramoyl-pentapeptide-transferase
MNITEILILMGITFVAAVALGPVVIPTMRRLKARQTERDDGPQSHLKKQGTPTIGGLIFLVPIILVSVIFALIRKEYGLIVPAVCVFGYGLIGFLDDFLKIKKRSKDGLYPWQKMLALLLLSLGLAFWLFFKGGDNITVLTFDMFGHTADLDIKWFFIPYAVFVLLATTNAVNLTDGLDGLCSGISAIVYAMISCVAFSLGADPSMQAFGFICAAGLIAFLIFNYNPARIFMGDTGSLALGGGIAIMTLIMRRPLLLILGGLIFVIEALSDIIQVSVFKLSGRKKRVFKMAPIHHHFELSGWSEKRVVWTFWIFTLVMCVFTYLTVCLIR